MTRSGRSLRASVVLALSLFAGRAFSQTAAAQLSPEDQARRRELITNAQQSSTQGDRAQALSLAERAGQMRMSPSLRRFIADEQVALGQLVRALASAQACVREEEADAAAVGRDVDLPACRALVQSLPQRIGHLVVRPPAHAPAGLRIQAGGEDVNPALWAVPFAVNPGAIEVVATAPGTPTFRRTVSVATASTMEVQVAFGPGASDGTASAGASDAHPGAASSAGAGTPSGPASGATADQQSNSGSLQRTMAWVALGASGVSLVGGVVASVLRENQAAAFNVRSPTHACQANGGTITGTSTCADEAAGVDSAQTWAIVGYVASGAFAATGLVLLLTAPQRSSESGSHAAVNCGVGPGTFGIACAGTF
jgi:hypothetical protein